MTVRTEQESPRAPLSSDSDRSAPPQAEDRRTHGERREGPRREADIHRERVLVELLKYPVLVFSIFLAIFAANKLLGITFGAVASVGTDGVKFVSRTEDVSARVVQLETQLKDALFALDVLQRKTALLPMGIGDSAAVLDRRFEQLQQVSSDVAALGRSLSERDSTPLAAGKVGYIWLGNFDPAANRWARAMATAVGGGALPLPSAVAAGDELVVSGSMVLRDGAPVDGRQYFSARSALGVVPRNSMVTVEEVPRGYRRTGMTQYWVRVRVNP